MKLVITLLGILTINNLALAADDYCNGQTCEPGVISRYECHGDAGGGGPQNCSYEPVTVAQCTEGGCYNAPVSNVEQCIQLGVSDCTVRPMRLAGKDGAIDSSVNYENYKTSEREYTYECTDLKTDDVIYATIKNAKIKVITKKGVLFIKNLKLKQLSPTENQDLEEFTTIYSDKNGNKVLQIEDYNFDSLANGKGFGVLKKYTQLRCRNN